MIAELGAFSLALAFAASLVQMLSGGLARLTGRPALSGLAKGAALAAFIAIAIAFFSLMAGFITSDFSIAFVANNSHIRKPLLYKIAGVWAGHEGSLLLWCLALTGFGAALALARAQLSPALRASAVMVQGFLGALFLGFTLFTSNPFARLNPAPVVGRSLNPLLQDPALAFHPPFLYGGYVGFSVVFSLSVAALIEGETDAAFARWIRPWTLAAFSLLTIGITLGAFWAYYELGWGGWWFWDPVENASFMPWLAGAALLHSSVVSERRGALLGWTVFLSLLAFTLSMLGAFLVRSGVLTSVHAFAVDPTRGAVLLGVLGLAAGLAFALFAWRAPHLPGGGLFGAISRESALLANNIFVGAALSCVLLGTLYPLTSEAITGHPVSIGAPYFNLTFAPLMAAALLILPIGILLSWKRADLIAVAQRLKYVYLAAALIALIAAWSLQDHSAFGAIAVGVGSVVVLGALFELSERIHLFKTPAAEALRRFQALPRGALGASLAHIGLGLFVIGAGYQTAARIEAAEALSLGDHLQLGQYQVRLDKVGSLEGPNYVADQASLTVLNKSGGVVCQGAPQRRFYPDSRQTTSEVALCFQPLTDLYLVFGEPRPGAGGKTAWLVRAYVNPLVRLIFLGPLLIALGGALSLSDRRLRLGAPKPATAAKTPKGSSRAAPAAAE